MARTEPEQEYKEMIRCSNCRNFIDLRKVDEYEQKTDGKGIEHFNHLFCPPESVFLLFD